MPRMGDTHGFSILSWIYVPAHSTSMTEPLVIILASAFLNFQYFPNCFYFARHLPFQHWPAYEYLETFIVLKHTFSLYIMPALVRDNNLDIIYTSTAV